MVGKLLVDARLTFSCSNASQVTWRSIESSLGWRSMVSLLAWRSLASRFLPPKVLLSEENFEAPKIFRFDWNESQLVKLSRLPAKILFYKNNLIIFFYKISILATILKITGPIKWKIDQGILFIISCPVCRAFESLTTVTPNCITLVGTVKAYLIRSWNVDFLDYCLFWMT